MGMFDRVYFRCPNGCPDPVEVQSKAGRCTLASISQSHVPWSIAVDIIGEHAFCETCKRSFLIRRKVESLDTVPLELASAP